MAEIRQGLRSVLSYSRAYETLQALMGASETRRRFVAQYVRPIRGQRILDIGCGPAEILRYLPEVDYVGYDINPLYIARAKQRYAGRGQFIARPFDATESASHPPFDVAVVSAVLHHLDDTEARTLFALLRRSLKPGGRVVTLDNVFVDGQNFIARTIIKWDRGQNVRSPEGYESLARPHFTAIKGEVVHKTFIPYTYWLMECS